MDWWLLTFFLGAILSLFLPEVPAIFQLFLLLCLAIAFFYQKKLRYGSGLCFGALWILSQAYLNQHQLTETLTEQMHNKSTFTVQGQVLSLKVKADNTLSGNQASHTLSTLTSSKVTKRFNFLVNNVNGRQLSSPVRVRLSWQAANLDIAQGNKLLLKVRLKPAHGLSNIGGFNYVSWLKAHNVVATGYVITPKSNSGIQGKSKEHRNKKQEVDNLNELSKNQVLEERSSIRQQLFQQYQQLAPNHELVGILLALAFGERSLLTAKHWQVLQATGTSHLIAISGLHVGLLAGSAFFIFMLVFRYLPISAVYWRQMNIRYVAIAVSITMAVAYAYLAGFSLPTQRALTMLVLYWSSRLFGIKLSNKRLILLTVFALLIISPFSLLTASFWLSFYAVAVIFITLWRFKFWLDKGSVPWRFFKGLIIVQLSLTLMLIPISAMFFQKISLLSLAANFIAVPWMSMVSIPCALLSVLFMPMNETLAYWLMTISLESLTWLWQYLLVLAEQPYAIILLSWRQQLISLIVGAVTFYLFYLLSTSWLCKSKYVAGALFVALLTTSLSLPLLSLKETQASNVIETAMKVGNAQQPGKPWQVVFFDVGQGLSVLIKRNNHGILYDTGAAFPSGFNMSESVILPYLQYIDTDKLDKVILSHSDNDHAGGIAKLLDNIRVDELITNDSNMALIKPINTRISTIKPSITSASNNLSADEIPKVTKLIACQPNTSFTWQGLTFDILWPLEVSVDRTVLSTSREATKQKNDDSCVILITDQQSYKVLLTGDISRKVERKLLSIYPQLSADILQVPHHGSKSSSSSDFIGQISAKVAVASAGYLNRWHMPVASVKQRYYNENIELLNNAELGQIIITIDEKGISKQSFVEDLRPFWFSH